MHKFLQQLMFVSIHAPTKGATLPIQKSTQFQLFQSTLPRRERPHIVTFYCRFFSFNPRSHEGSDKETEAEIKKLKKFQSTLPRRERLSFRRSFFRFSSFQSTLPRRERLSFRRSFFAFPRFNPRSHEGSDSVPHHL